MVNFFVLDKECRELKKLLSDTEAEVVNS